MSDIQLIMSMTLATYFIGGVITSVYALVQEGRVAAGDKTVYGMSMDKAGNSEEWKIIVIMWPVFWAAVFAARISDIGGRRYRREQERLEALRVMQSKDRSVIEDAVCPTCRAPIAQGPHR